MTISEALELYKLNIGKTVHHIIYSEPDDHGISNITVRAGTLEKVAIIPSGTLIVAYLKEFPNYPISAQLLKLKDETGIFHSIVDEF